MRFVSAVIAVAALAVLPSLARAADDPCATSCAADRPFAMIALDPEAPRDGAPVTLTATGVGYGDTYAWDLDGDGVYDDATGATVTHTFTGAQASFGVRVTDAFGRAATETRTLALHAFNAAPTGKLDVLGSMVTGSSTYVTATGSDLDGKIADTSLDLDGDGTFETHSAIHAVHLATAGVHQIAARFTDDSGATTVVKSDLDVHDANLPPTLSLQFAQGDGSMTIGAPLVAGPVNITAYADGRDNLGNGGPENRGIEELYFSVDDFTHATPVVPSGSLPPGAAGVLHTTLTPGVHEVQVQAIDAGGSETSVRESVLVLPGDGSDTKPPLVVASAGQIARPGVPAVLHAYDLRPGDTLTWDTDHDGDFDDGTGQTITHTFPQGGSPDVRVLASGPGGTRLESFTVIVKDDPGLPPIVSLGGGPGPVRAGHTAPFEAVAQTADGGPGDITTTYDLDGDGQFDDDPATFVYTAPTTIAAKATDGGGRSAIATMQVTPLTGNVGPRLTVLPMVGGPFGGELLGALSTPGTPITFDGFSTDTPGDSCCTVAWDGDGDGVYDDGSFANFQHAYTAGEHALGFKATDGDGATATLRRTFSIGTHSPKVTLTPDGTYVDASATDPDGDAIASVKWDLDGDGAYDDATGARVRAPVGDHLVGAAVTDAAGDIGVAHVHATGQPQLSETLPLIQPVTPGVTPAPVPKLLALSLARVAAVKRTIGSLRVSVGCTGACRATVTLKLGSHVLARATSTGGKVTLKLSAKARRLLRGTHSRKLTLTVAAPGAKTLSRSVAIRR